MYRIENYVWPVKSLQVWFRITYKNVWLLQRGYEWFGCDVMVVSEEKLMVIILNNNVQNEWKVI